MKKLINAVDAVVCEQLMGMAAAHPELKVRIEPHYITRADSPVMGKVALVVGRIFAAEWKKLNIGTVIIALALVVFYAGGWAI